MEVWSQDYGTAGLWIGHTVRRASSSHCLESSTPFRGWFTMLPWSMKGKSPVAHFPSLCTAFSRLTVDRRLGLPRFGRVFLFPGTVSCKPWVLRFFHLPPSLKIAKFLGGPNHPLRSHLGSRTRLTHHQLSPGSLHLHAPSPFTILPTSSTNEPRRFDPPQFDSPSILLPRSDYLAYRLHATTPAAGSSAPLERFRRALISGEEAGTYNM